MLATAKAAILSALLLPVAAAQALGQEPATMRYTGACDGSAAVALGPDHFVVADDERDVLLVYRRGRPDPVGSTDLVEVLGNRGRKGKPKEADLEGAARLGDRIYWIASHGRDSKGDEEPNRQRFFATDIVEAETPPKVVPAGKPYRALLLDMLADPQLASLGLAAASNKAPKAPDGLSIEGLAATPEGGLLVGFRNPVPGGEAIIVELLNPADVIETGAKARFGAAIGVKLGGQGIRSIERVGTSYLIVAGPSGEDGPAFALYRWAGRGTDPEKLATSLGAGRPEALLDLPGTPGMLVLSDDGEEPVDGKTCKDKAVPAARKGFRATIIPRP